jgi:hypothetical protein
MPVPGKSENDRNWKELKGLKEIGKFPSGPLVPIFWGDS